MEKIDMHNIISSEEAASIIETSVKTLMANPEMANVIPAIMLRGAPGVGKSTIVKSVAKKLGIGFIDVRLAQMERVDFAGLPSVKDGVTEWNIPAFWPKDKNSCGILLLDEITSAPADCQVAAYSVVLDRMVPNSGYKLPNGWFIVAAGNRAGDKAVVKSLSSALANRFVHFEIEANADDWSNWAVKNEVNPSVIGYINYKPGNLFKMDGQNLEQGWPSPRSWERVSSIIPLYKDSEAILRKVVYGLIGNSVGLEFMEFFKLNKQFGNVLNMMLDENAEITIPEKADEKYAMAYAVIYHVWNGKSEKESEMLLNGFFKFLDKMPNSYAAMMIKAVMQGSKSVSKIDAMTKLMNHKDYKTIAAKFKTSFTETNMSLAI